LGNRVQHALRAYTAKDQRALRLAAETYRDNPRFNTQDAILRVGVGEAVTSFLEKKGMPGVVERTLISPPSSQLGPITSDERQGVVKSSPLFGKYETPIDRRSAYEIISERAKAAAAEAAMEEEKSDLAEDPMQREFATARRYSGTRLGRSRRVGVEDVGSALGQALVKELKGTTGRRIIRKSIGEFKRFAISRNDMVVFAK
jgi:hypothetical protein